MFCSRKPTRFDDPALKESLLRVSLDGFPSSALFDGVVLSAVTGKIPMPLTRVTALLTVKVGESNLRGVSCSGSRYPVESERYCDGGNNRRARSWDHNANPPPAPVAPRLFQTVEHGVFSASGLSNAMPSGDI